MLLVHLGLGDVLHGIDLGEYTPWQKFRTINLGKFM